METNPAQTHVIDDNISAELAMMVLVITLSEAIGLDPRLLRAKIQAVDNMLSFKGIQPAGLYAALHAAVDAASKQFDQQPVLDGVLDRPAQMRAAIEAMRQCVFSVGGRAVAATA
jgi:hypothetical protein